MNKTEFVDAVAERADVQKSDAAKIVDALVDVVGDQLKKGEQITLVGFGTFLVSKREARKGRNPRTGEEIDIAASNVPRFKPGKALKESIN
jgi:DNA-binding protein HU-beta